MSKPIQFKKLLLLMLLFSSSINVFSQTQETYIDNQWQNSRYIDHGDGTVTDTKTGLMWKRCSEGLSSSGGCTGTATKYTYKDAIEHVGGITFANHNDWRLPNIKELVSLVAYDRYNPAINSTLFPKTPINSAGFWSSSPSVIDTPAYPFAWRLYFGSGTTERGHRLNNYYVRLVRGGQ